MNTFLFLSSSLPTLLPLLDNVSPYTEPRLGFHDGCGGREQGVGPIDLVKKGSKRPEVVTIMLTMAYSSYINLNIAFYLKK